MLLKLIQVAKQSRTVPANNFDAEVSVRSKTLLPTPSQPTRPDSGERKASMKPNCGQRHRNEAEDS